MLLFDVKVGTLKVSMDAALLSAKRKAAASASALASRFLSRENCETSLVMDSWILSSQLIEAHASVHPINTVYMGQKFSESKASLSAN